MRNAEHCVRAALLSRLWGDAALMALLNRVYDGAPVRAAMPYAFLGDAIGADWGTKDAEGRELRIGLTIRDEAQDAERIGEALPRIEAAFMGLSHADLAGEEQAGWRLGSVLLIRSALTTPSPGQWACSLDYRIRILAAV